jgi:hypothetical protein
MGAFVQRAVGAANERLAMFPRTGPRDMHDVDRGWKLSYEERQKARKECEEQIEQDQRDFDRLFRVSNNRRAAHACSDFGEYAAFIREHLSISAFSAPVDGDDITRILHDAVRDGQIVPAISRAWWGSRRVARQYAPQSWPKPAPDLKPTIYSFRGGQLVPLDANGRFIDDSPYVPTRIAAKVAATAGARSGGGDGASGSDWLGAAETVAGAVLGGAGSSDGESMLKSFGDTDDSEGGSLLSDTLPFEYQPDALSDDVTELAARGVNEAQEAECFAEYDIDMEMCSAGGAMYNSPAYYLECKARAFQKYQQCRGY